MSKFPLTAIALYETIPGYSYPGLFMDLLPTKPLGSLTPKAAGRRCYLVLWLQSVINQLDYMSIRLPCRGRHAHFTGAACGIIAGVALTLCRLAFIG